MKTIEDRKVIMKVRELLMFTEDNGDVCNGFRTRDIIKELRLLVSKYDDELKTTEQ